MEIQRSPLISFLPTPTAMAATTSAAAPLPHPGVLFRRDMVQQNAESKVMLCREFLPKTMSQLLRLTMGSSFAVVSGCLLAGEKSAHQ